LKKTYIAIFTAISLLSACKKENIEQPLPTAEPCIMQTANPAGRSYTNDSVVSYTCTSKHCGFIPLSTKNYWVYQDSVFNDGVFAKVKFDTLRYTTTWKSLSDDLVWWESNISVGLPDKLYANDSALFRIQDRMFIPGIKDARKDFSLFPGDSLRYLASFDDVAASGRSLKLSTVIKCPAGSFDNCLYFEKNARSYRKDQVFFKPGIGVIRYVHEMAQMGSPYVKLQQVSTLVAYHIE
jgi:hypothetical protein